MRVLVELGSDAGVVFRVEAGSGDTLEIGRVLLLDLGVPQDLLMSARHFAIVCEHSQCRIRDLGSTNGTFVNDVKITEAMLKNGDRVEAGRSVFTVWLHHESVADRGEGPRIAAGRRPRQSSSPGEPRATAATAFADERAASPAAAIIPILEIGHHSPLPVSTVRWRDADDKPKLTVAVKATFAIGPSPELTRQQLPVFNTDIASEEHPGSVRFESDLVPFKPCTDVVLVGRAHAPDGKPVTELIAGVRVGQLRAGIAVFGDRTWQSQLLDTPSISQAQPFLAMDLVYERAFGGFDEPAGMYCKENHVGTGFLGKRTGKRIEGLRLPNLEDPRNQIDVWNSRPRPVGFGFYGRGWAPRLAYAGTYDDKHMKERHPLLPADFSYRFFNGAHPDLQVEGYLRGDEEVDLLNVCPGAPRVHFRLPGLVPKITVARWTVPPEQWVQEHAGPDGSLPADLPLVEESLKPVLDTLVFVPDQGVFYEVFRAVCDLSSLDSLEIARITVAH